MVLSTAPARRPPSGGGGVRAARVFVVAAHLFVQMSLQWCQAEDWKRILKIDFRDLESIPPCTLQSSFHGIILCLTPRSRRVLVFTGSCPVHTHGIFVLRCPAQILRGRLPNRSEPSSNDPNRAGFSWISCGRTLRLTR